jgi:hypothetical protein
MIAVETVGRWMLLQSEQLAELRLGVAGVR